MNTKQFIEEFAQVVKSGKVKFLPDLLDNGDGQIRLKDSVPTTFCPITALVWCKTGKEFQDYLFVKAGKTIGLDCKSASRIAGAADNDTNGPIRKSLLKACTLTEVKYNG